MMYFFDPIPLFTTVLSSTGCSKVYTGIAAARNRLRITHAIEKPLLDKLRRPTADSNPRQLHVVIRYKMKLRYMGVDNLTPLQEDFVESFIGWPEAYVHKETEGHAKEQDGARHDKDYVLRRMNHRLYANVIRKAETGKFHSCVSQS